MIEIDYIMELLNCNNSEENQIRGLELAKDVKCIDVFLKPKYPYGEEVWENCAKIIFSKTDDELMPYLYDLFHWVKDLNDVGASLILKRLKNSVADSRFNFYLKKCIEESNLINNKIWNHHLNEIGKSVQKENFDEITIMELLDCNNSETDQKKGRKLAQSINDLHTFIAPIDFYNTWENCAKILSEKDDQKLMDYLFELCEWVQNENCPQLIIERLKRMKNNKRILTVLDICIKKASDLNNNKWEQLLYNIKENVVNNTKKDSNSTNIDYIINLLNWECSSQDQEKGIKLGKKVKCINAFVMPSKPLSKEVWENCAKILSSKSDEELSDYLFELLEWLQDLNWPGALIIAERLKKYSKDNKLETVKKGLSKSKLENDELWEKNLFDIFFSNL